MGSRCNGVVTIAKLADGDKFAVGGSEAGCQPSVEVEDVCVSQAS